MNKLDKDYKNLIKDVLENGVVKKDRTGTGTISVFGRQIRHKMSSGFPMLTTKKIPFKTMVTELIWFLRGDTNIKYLVDNGCNIWVGDCYKKYCLESRDIDLPENLYNKLIDDLNEKAMFPIDNPNRRLTQDDFIDKIKTDDEFAKEWGELGPIYGKQWREWVYMGPKSQQEMLDENTNWSWKISKIDQIQNLINDLKTNPDSRRLMVNAYNVGELDSMTLPPCHYGFQVYTRELSLEERKNLVPPIPNLFTHEDCDVINIPKRTISLIFNMRSTDVGLGLPFNLASYGLLLMILAKEVNMVPDELIYSGGDVHIYSNHVDGLKEQLTREPYELPNVNILKDKVDDISDYEISDFELINYKSHPTIKLPLSN